MSQGGKAMRHRHDFVLHVSWGLPRDSSICGRGLSLNVDAVQASESDKRELDRASPTGLAISSPDHFYFTSPDSWLPKVADRSTIPVVKNALKMQ